MTQDIALTLRGRILEAARAATEGDRNKTYGDPAVQLELAGRMKQLIREYFADYGMRDICPGEWEATDIELTKVSRRILGAYHPDNYIDSAAYSAIAGECAARHGSLKDRANEYFLKTEEDK